LGSFSLGKNDTLNNSYFMFNGGSGYNQLWWFDEYDKLDLGKTIGSYKVTSISGVNIYWREFEKGYVYVNPTATNVSAITLPQASRQITHDTLFSTLSSLPTVNTISLRAHNAAFLTKTTASSVDTIAPSVPIGLTATAVSGTQVNLAWQPSTDNVAVKGYYIYLNDVALTTITGTSFQHTGLTAGTTYSYRVSAFDAVPNNSAWTATPVTVKTGTVTPTPTPTPTTDTVKPSVPTGLTATVVSGTQIKLAWQPSTDNVGVKGYYIYLNDVALTTTTATSFQHTGLTPGTTYNYRVSAFDAVPNHSAWTATPVTAKTGTAPTPTTDTVKPSVPAGLTATAVSPSQINLKWSSSTDNIGVTGYRVYRAGTLIATVGAVTSYQNTGLTAATLYTYTVTAIDAAGNASAQSIGTWATTQAVQSADTTAPSVPTGLTATVVSSTQINLSWQRSTDNVGVKGYYVYLNNVALTTTSGTSIQLTGLKPGTTYNYRVSAYDAVPNHSAWTATPVSVATPN
ncbi:MAG TPA: fibronectin type III domain-containing protein, partial [Burkholderiales bacterium]|nr:fibronectin type III domain-containing protein [Burkholderiales bacterium]